MYIRLLIRIMQYLQVILIVQEIKLAYVQKCKENTWTVHDQLFNLPMKFDFLKKVYNFMWKNVIKKVINFWKVNMPLT